MTIRNLNSLLEPNSITVIGASERPGSVGATVWRNLRAGAFRGPVYAVNAKRSSIDGIPAAQRVADLPSAPDLAVICTPPATVPGLVAELGRLGTRAAVVMTAGLTPEQKQAALNAARPHLLRLLGPNCLGLLSPHIGMNASFAHTDALPGDIAFVSQSGALVTAVVDWAKSRGIGFSRLLSIGEHADVDFGDLLDWLAGDRHTRAILLYIESIDAPRKFMSAARAAARTKPVIVVKAGRAGQGVQAATSHTGALAGSDLVFDAAIRRAGMLRVDTLADLFMAAETLARFNRPSDDLTVMTNGGGAGVMAADAAAQADVPLRSLDEPLRATLERALPPNWSRANPIDIIGDAPVERYVATLSALLDRPTGAVLFVHAPSAIVRSDEIARACVPLVREHAGRVMGCWLGSNSVQAARELFVQAGVADYATPEEAVRAFALMATYRRNQALLLQAPWRGQTSPPARERARALIERSIEQGRAWLAEADAKAVLEAYGIPIVPSALVADADAAVRAARSFGYPVALKIASPDIVHKSDVGGVALALVDEGALRTAAAQMLVRVREQRADARIDGFTLQPMASRPKAQELLVGASIDSVFGPVVMFGHGGVAVEVLADRAIALPPLNEPLARELVSRTRVAKLLAGWRDRPAADTNAICATLTAVSQMLADLPAMAELDINPLWADEHGVLALDARIRVDPARAAGAAHFAIRPYPDELEEHILWQLRALLLRPIRPDDGERHRQFIERLDPEDIRLRFFERRRELSAGELARMTQIDYEREMAFIALGTAPDGSEETLGVVRAVTDPDNIEAEFAVTVRSDLKGRGLGRVLMDKLVRYCRGRGTQRLTGYVLRENAPMIALARDLGFQIDAAGSDRDAFRFTKALT